MAMTASVASSVRTGRDWIDAPAAMTFARYAISAFLIA